MKFLRPLLITALVYSLPTLWYTNAHQYVHEQNWFFVFMVVATIIAYLSWRPMFFRERLPQTSMRETLKTGLAAMWWTAIFAFVGAVGTLWSDAAQHDTYYGLIVLFFPIIGLGVGFGFGILIGMMFPDFDRRVVALAWYRKLMVAAAAIFIVWTYLFGTY